MPSVRCVFITDIYCSVLHSRHISVVGEREFHRWSAYIQLCENLSVSQTNIIEAVGPRSLLFISPGLKRPGRETNHSHASPLSLRIPEMTRAIVHFPIGPIMCTETTDVGQLCSCITCTVQRSKRRKMSRALHITSRQLGTQLNNLRNQRTTTPTGRPV